MPTPKDLPRDIGEFIRDLRRNARISLRQLADQAGVSNPYLSQIERGLRRPSAEVLQQIASALRVSTPLMYLRAGLLDGKEGHEVLEAIAADPDLTAAQKQSLIQIYETFRRENAREAGNARGSQAPPESTPADDTDTGSGDTDPVDVDVEVPDIAGIVPSDAVAGPNGGPARTVPEQYPATNAAGKAATTKEI